MVWLAGLHSGREEKAGSSLPRQLLYTLLHHLQFRAKPLAALWPSLKPNEALKPPRAQLKGPHARPAKGPLASTPPIQGGRAPAFQAREAE